MTFLPTVKRAAACALLALLLGGCVTRETRTYYAPTDRNWSVGDYGDLFYCRRADSGAALEVCRQYIKYLPLYTLDWITGFSKKRIDILLLPAFYKSRGILGLPVSKMVSQPISSYFNEGIELWMQIIQHQVTIFTWLPSVKALNRPLPNCVGRRGHTCT